MLEDETSRIAEEKERETPLSRIVAGEAPGKGELICDLSVGIEFITDFWKEKYLQEYIREGGSKIKFVTGQKGSGKTHLLELISTIAEHENYITADFSARDIWMHDFRDIYVEILHQCDIVDCLKRCSYQIIHDLGFDYHEIPEGMTFMDYLSQNDLGDAITRREIRLQLKGLFLENPLIDNNFALACSLLTGGLLGHPLLEEQNKELLLAWLEGDKNAKMPALRSLGLSPSRITKFNARHMLRSLAEIIRIAGYSGILVTIDNLEILLSRSSLQPIHYTKLKREDTYESIRQLIDDIDSMKHVMFIFAFDRELLDNDSGGIKSYQALWMRIQNEIVGERFNRFTDIVDLDRLAAQEYTPDVLVEMSEKLTAFVNEAIGTAFPIDRDQGESLIHKAKLGGISVPRLVNRAVLGGEK